MIKFVVEFLNWSVFFMPIISLVDMIEKKRKQMFEIAELYGLNDDKTVNCSQELDHLLNMYRKVMNGTYRNGYSSVTA
jgi:stage 0 sporulation regulatory protein